MALRPLPQAGLPQVTFEAIPRPVLAPLRTDIAIFVGSTRWGVVGEPVRIDGWREFESAFGGHWSGAHTPYAVHGYFENGGRIAYMLRLAASALPANSSWDVLADSGFAPAALDRSRFFLSAATPGTWANRLSIRPTYRRSDAGAPLIDLDIHLDGRLVEQLTALNCASLSDEVTARSLFLRMTPDPAAVPVPALPGAGPNLRRWDEITLDNGSDGSAPSRDGYRDALGIAVDELEPALVVLPDLHLHLNHDNATAVLLAAARLCDVRLDRLVVADAPEALETRNDAEQWLGGFNNDPAVHRALATYQPWIEIRDPLGTPLAPLRKLPASGHVAGAISRLDRAQGAYVTPANVVLAEAIDLSRRPTPADQIVMSEMGLNTLRCHSGQGIMIWGGRMTRSDDIPRRFVAHRRLIHRIVRALRRVWQPMVFEPNDIALRFAIARSATTLLFEAFQAGVLKGTRPEEAFRVNVDETLNDQIARDAGRVLCEISLAPATPMEFIHLRISVSTDGNIEMVEP